MNSSVIRLANQIMNEAIVSMQHGWEASVYPFQASEQAGREEGPELAQLRSPGGAG
ncbi:MAG: hypothetical protein ACOYKZ_01780 [Chlamydiia bacterium]